MNTYSEHAILRLVEAGNKGEALKAIFNTYGGQLTAICRRYIPIEGDVHDVLQDTMLQIHRSMGSFKWHGDGSLESWLKRVAANEALQAVRREMRLHEMSLNDIQEPADDSDPPYMPQVEPRVLQAMIRELPPGYRAILNMYVFDDFSHKEISKELGISIYTSASQLLRAKKILKEKLTKYIKQHE